jgi:hypothetical protein
VVKSGRLCLECRSPEHDRELNLLVAPLCIRIQRIVLRVDLALVCETTVVWQASPRME